ncbi:MAG: MerR family transcriptional regulator [Deltaproteobacteria bacterium]|nr:MerR family transcriptional regulator [Deltaproteobacteria bacterium]
MNPPREARHRIGAVASLTGLSTHAIRAWERRYGAVEPVRTPAGDRLYSDDDVARLGLMGTLTKLGHGIREIARLSIDELRSLTERHDNLERKRASDESALAKLVAALDVAALSRGIRARALELNARELVMDVLIPLLQQVGTEWEVGRLGPRHEHMTTAIVRQRLDGIISGADPGPDAKVAIASTLSGELHEVGALAGLALAAIRGFRVVYLGPNLPAFEIAETAIYTNASLVLISALSGAAPAILELRRALPEPIALIVGGPGASGVEAWPDGPRMESLDELEQWLLEQSPKR